MNKRPFSPPNAIHLSVCLSLFHETLYSEDDLGIDKSDDADDSFSFMTLSSVLSSTTPSSWVSERAASLITTDWEWSLRCPDRVSITTPSAPTDADWSVNGLKSSPQRADLWFLRILIFVVSRGMIWFMTPLSVPKRTTFREFHSIALGMYAIKRM